jgi:S-formylglutathione hydrolase FrmB
MAGSITIEDFQLVPEECHPGESFEVRLKVSAKDVPVVSYVLRTTEPAPAERCPPALDHYVANRKLAFVSENGQVHLADNGPHDRDPADNAFAILVSTDGWKPGQYRLAVFAHNRPGSGAHIVDHRAFTVIVEADRVRLIDAGRIHNRFTRFGLSSEAVHAGEPVALKLAFESQGATGVEMRQTYHVAEENVPPPFNYDQEKRIGFLAEDGNPLLSDNGPLDSDPAERSMAIDLDTSGWQPGLYYLEVTLSGGVGDPDLRHCCLSIQEPDAELVVDVSPSWVLCPGTHAERMARLSDGALVHASYFSTDDGMTWHKRETGTIGPGSEQLRDGRVLGMGYKTLPIEGREGWYLGQRYESTDNGRTVAGPLDAEFYVPQAKAAHGHALHKGPLYMRSIVERPDGVLVALMAGWFKGDDKPCPYNPRRPYSRTYVCESLDGGRTWAFLANIGYDFIGSEGYNEGSMKALPDGRLMAVMRTGSMKDPKCQDNPIMVATSADGGATWTTPRRTGVHGAFPDLAVLSDGILAITYGRPGAGIVFSTDNGETWANWTSIDATPYSGYTTVVEMAQGELLVAFGTRDYLDPQTGTRSSNVRLATVRYRKKSAGPGPLATLIDSGVTVKRLGRGFFEGTVTSKALGRDESFMLHLPFGHTADAESPYPLIVFLHGAGRHAQSIMEYPAARDVIERSPCVFLSPNGRGSWWVDSPVEEESRYQSFLLELIDLITARLNVSSDPSRRAIGGWSMGGFGSANFIEDHPDQFSTWGGIIPLVDFPNPDYAPADNHSIPAVLGDADNWLALNPINKDNALRGKHLFFITAENAFERKMNEAFSEKLRAEGIEHTFRVIPGGHTIDVVLAAFPEVMDFFHERIAGPATHFTFEKKGVLIETPAGMPKPGPYYTVLVRMAEVPDFPYEYALYFSTDHARGAGGIWLYVCNGLPTEPANWKSYDQALADGDFDYLEDRPKANPIFVDRVQGGQTETPHVNVIDHTVFMTYHNAGAGHGQSTLLATSKDGVSFARINGKEDSVILDYDSGKEVGDGHTGYFRWRPNPYPGVNHKYVGYSLHGGGDDFHGAMWVSDDAMKWEKVQIFDSIEGYAVEGTTIVRRRSIDPNSITPLGNGEFVALCSLGNRASGTVKRRLQFYEVFLASDGKTLTRQCRKVLSNGLADALDAEELGQATTVVINGTWHLIYVGTRDGAGRNTIMCATGRLDLDAPNSEPLKPGEVGADLRK